MNRNDDLLNQALKTEQAGCRKDDTQCCGKCRKPTYEKLEAQVKQLAAENAALKNWAENRAKSDDALEQERYSTLKIDYRQRLLSNIQTPATDAYADSLRAEGVEMLANDISGKAMKSERGSTAFALLLAQAEYAKEFAAQLRSKSEVQS